MNKIYEVMAIENAYPLFFLEHIKRLHGSINSFKHYDMEELVQVAVKLIRPQLQKKLKDNIKLSYDCKSDKFSLEIRKSTKPDITLYETGATVGILKAERDNPLVKMENLTQRNKSEKICLDSGYYDLLLENRHGEITEGSKSNFLCIDKIGNILTSPIGDALNGITRETIFDICSKRNIRVIQQKINIKTLNKIDSLIITGTSPGILPIKNCGDINFAVKNGIIDILQKEYSNRKLKDLYITEEFFNKW